MPGDNSQVDKGQRGCRQNQMLQRVKEHIDVAFQQRIDQIKAGHAGWRVKPVVKAPAAGQPVQFAVKQDNHSQPQPERRGRDSGQRHQANQVIGPAVAIHRRKHPQRNTDHQRDKQGAESQFERGREKGL